MVYFFTVGFHDGVANTHVQFALDNPLEVDLVGYQSSVGRHLPAEFDLAGTQRAAAAGATQPAEVEAD